METKQLTDRKHDSYIKREYVTEYSISSLNRYKHSTQFLLADDKMILGNLNPWDMVILLKSASLGEYTVTASEENRIDIVATIVYGRASLYWVLCYYNGIKDPLSLPVGTRLIIPNLKDLFSYPNPLA